MEAKQIWNSFIPSHHRAGVQPFPGKQDSITLTVTYEEKIGNSEHPPFLLHSPALLLSTMSHSLRYPFGQLGSAVLAVSPPNFLYTLSLLTGEVLGEAKNVLALCLV